MKTKQNKNLTQNGALSPPPLYEIEKVLGISSLNIEWLAGDGSDRCYYRLSSPHLDLSKYPSLSSEQKSLVLMQLSGSDAILLKEDGYDWVKIAQTLKNHSIYVPNVIAVMPGHAALIIEDYGDLMLETRVFELAEKDDGEKVREMYRNAFHVISKFIGIPFEKNSSWKSITAIDSPITIILRE